MRPIAKSASMSLKDRVAWNAPKEMTTIMKGAKIVYLIVVSFATHGDRMMQSAVPTTFAIASVQMIV
jgi:hypothetical protein